MSLQISTLYHGQPRDVALLLDAERDWSKEELACALINALRCIDRLQVQVQALQNVAAASKVPA